MKTFLTLMFLVLVSCAATARDAQPDPALLAAIQKMRAIDNHAHPLRAVAPDKTDNEDDALDLVPLGDVPLFARVRGDNIEYIAAWKQLYGYPYSDTKHEAELTKLRAAKIAQLGDGYPSWVLDQVGIETMLADRVSMGGGVTGPRFLWVPYDDALMYPLDNSAEKARNADRKIFFASEEELLKRYLQALGITARPATLDEWLSRVVTPTLTLQRKAGAVAIKFEAAYLRSLDFDEVSHAKAAAIYARGGVPSHDDYEALQSYIFHYIAAEAGRLGLVVHVHVAAGIGSYFDVKHGARAVELESIFNDPTLRGTKFVILHGGWPFTDEAMTMLTKPNVYADFSFQTYASYPHALARVIRAWLEYMPEKVLYGTDAYSYGTTVRWEETAWLADRSARWALASALTGMMEDGEITRERALELAQMVLRGNARALYGISRL